MEKLPGNHYVTTVLHEGDLRGALATTANVSSIDRGSLITVLVPEGRTDLARLLAARGIDSSFGPKCDTVPTRGESEFRMLLQVFGMVEFDSVIFIRPGFILRDAEAFDASFAAMAARGSHFEPLGSHIPVALVRPNALYANRIQHDFESRLKRIRSRGEHLTFPAFIIESEELSTNLTIPLRSQHVINWDDLEDAPAEKLSSAAGIYVDPGHTPWFHAGSSTSFSRNLRRTGQWSRLAAYELLHSYSLGGTSKAIDSTLGDTPTEKIDLSVFNQVHASNPFKEIGCVVVRRAPTAVGKLQGLEAAVFYDVQHNRAQIERLLAPNTGAWNTTGGIRPIDNDVLRAGMFKMASAVIVAPQTDLAVASRLQCEAAACGAVPIVVDSLTGLPLESPRLESSPTPRRAVSLAVTLERSSVLRQTEAHRLARRVFEAHSDVYDRPASFFCTSKRPYELPTVLANFNRQSLGSKELILGTHGFDVQPEEFRKACEETGTDPSLVKLVHLPDNWVLGECLNAVIDRCDGELFIRYDDDEFYAPNYARDSLLALKYSSAEIVGKRAFFLYSEQYDSTGLIGPELECRYVDHVMGGTFCGHRDVFRTLKFQPVPSREDALFLIELARSGGRIYSTDRFNFSMNRKSDVTRHTWNSNIDDFFIDGTILAPGFAKNLISV